MNVNFKELNNRGTLEISLRARQAEQSYQQWKQERAQVLSDKPSFLGSTRLATFFSLIVIKILVKIRKPAEKQVEFVSGDWGEVHAGQ